MSPKILELIISMYDFKVFVNNICLITISISPSDWATKISTLTIERAWQDKLYQEIWACCNKSFLWCRFKNAQFYKQCMDSIVVFPPRNFTFFNISPKELENSPVTKYYKLFKCLESFASSIMTSLYSHMLMKQDVNNDISNNSPITLKAICQTYVQSTSLLLILNI